MPLRALRIKPGVFRENTRYSAEGRWYFSDKVRFRSGQPEKIGGWVRNTVSTFLGVCTSLFPWVTNAANTVLGVMTSTRQYVYDNGVFVDISPVRYTAGPLVNAITATPGSSVITIATQLLPQVPEWAGSWIEISDAVGLGGNITAAVLNKKHTIDSIVNLTSSIIAIDVGVVANASDTGNGGTATLTKFFEPAWTNYYSQSNFGQDLLFGRSGGALCAFDGSLAWLIPNNVVTISIASPAVVTTAVASPPGVFLNPASGRVAVVFETTGALPTGLVAGTTYYMEPVSSSGGTTSLLFPTADSTVPINTSGTQSGVHSIVLRAITTPIVRQNFLIVSDASRFVIVFGCNDFADDNVWPGPVFNDPMLIRWSDQESYTDWTQTTTNQAGSVRLSRGSRIEAVAQVRQEILVWTDTSLYSLQYLGPPVVWSPQILADNISIVSGRAWAVAAGVTYWMGLEKFYIFDGRTQTLPCDLRQYIFNDFNFNKISDVFASTIEQFNEVWWFYCSADSQTINRYVVYNYLEQIWYYGTMERSAWIDASVFSDVPLAADYSGRLLNHETGCDDDSTGTPQPINSYITSSEFDIEDGHNFSFIWRVLPDITFSGSTTVAPAQPSVQFSLLTLQNSGSGYTRGIDPVATESTDMSVAGDSSLPVTRVVTTTVERFTQQINTRVRARQMSLKVASSDLGVQWQLGTPRIDLRPDGRKS
jgi:hypothetical protein